MTMRSYQVIHSSTIYANLGVAHSAKTTPRKCKARNENIHKRCHTTVCKNCFQYLCGNVKCVREHIRKCYA